jgi:glutamate N-acetyltransferase/amino-acid N-acetyltransferase
MSMTVSAVKADLYGRDRYDMAAFVFGPDVTMAGVFTQNAFCAAPVHIARAHLAGQPRAWLINTKSANAGTGEIGHQDALDVCAAFATQLGLDADQVLPFSTGVIGERLPLEKIHAALPQLITDGQDWASAAQGIMTTDTRPKQAQFTCEVDGVNLTIEGIAKGSGMIQPNMATMLGFVVTNAKVAQADLQAALSASANASFNRITVDGDTSTNDACMLAATGEGPALGPDSPQWPAFIDGLNQVMVELAQAIVRDGEGATKFVEIQVTGAASDEDAHQVAKTVAHSPLVKTALFASDANWGRILAAVGRAPIARLDVSQVQIWIGDVKLVSQGAVDPDYTEEAGAAVFAQSDISIRIDLGSGQGETTVWTCDFSHEYVSINADYRS